MIKLKDILKEEKILVPRHLKIRDEEYKRIIYKKIQDYIKNGSKGTLNLTGTPITKLPDNLKIVKGDLLLNDSKIQFLPDGLKIYYNLELVRTPISHLPNNLTTDNIYASESNLNSIPYNLNINDVFFINSTPLCKKYNADQIKDIIKEKGGKVYQVWE